MPIDSVTRPMSKCNELKHACGDVFWQASCSVSLFISILFNSNFFYSKMIWVCKNTTFLVDSFTSKWKKRKKTASDAHIHFYRARHLSILQMGIFFCRPSEACSCKCRSNVNCHINVCGLNISNEMFVRSQYIIWNESKESGKIVSIKYFVRTHRIPMDLRWHFWCNVEVAYVTTHSLISAVENLCNVWKGIFAS